MVTGRHGVDPGRPWVDPGSTPSGNLLCFALPSCRSHPRTSYLLCLGVPPLRHDARSRTSLARVHGNADHACIVHTSPCDLSRSLEAQSGYGWSYSYVEYDQSIQVRSRVDPCSILSLIKTLATHTSYSCSVCVRSRLPSDWG